GSCSMPLAAHARWQADGTLCIDAAWGDPDATTDLVKVRANAQASDFAEARALGEDAARMLRAGGAH
ncbi:MAG: hydroxymethylbilane synthase, partial [Gammaproteobacteria bacterium]|nr:hydroxymethylbilane synthase [Gammaproteobacteria bacterium]